MHESYDQYDLCQHTERNGGLYTADQRMRRTDQRGTRQNPNGDRRGLECPEERDHYPWWHPSPWIDIAVLSNEGGDTPCTDPEECETARCKYYLENSFNRNQKGYCDVEHGQGVDASAKTSTAEWTGNRWHNNRAACEAAGFVWYMKSLDDVLTGLPYPTCAKTQFSRVNHLGNSADATVDATTGGSDDAPHGVNANRYLWTIPSIPAGRGGNVFEGNDGGGMQSAYASCTLRMRYNISSSDFPQWPIDAQEVAHDWLQEMVDSANNSVTDYSPNTPLIQDPYIFIGPGDDAESTDRFLSLAVNTNQYGRTFQDRSYKFAVRRRPTTAAASNDQTDTPKVPTTETDDKIYNINVRGKRGNIVQTFPAVEYDFVPNSLAVDVGDFVHFQWTGSDYNPRRGCNDAEGGPPDPNDFVGTSSSNSRADRSNLVFMNTMAENVPKDMEGTPTGGSDATFAAKAAAQKTASLEDVPCADSDACHDTIVRLAYLNQQSDGGALQVSSPSLRRRSSRGVVGVVAVASWLRPLTPHAPLQLRRGAGCLSTEELDDISNKNERENHSRNCAKLNAKPYPYFDGGLVKMARPGKYAYFSSRNNNLSNRDQTGIICVRGTDSNGEVFTCDVDGDTGALEDENRAVSTAEVRDISQTAMAASRCNEEASSNAAANNQGASSCILQAKAGLSDILTSESFTIEQQDNDAMGSGNALACTELRFTYPSGQTKFINGVGLAIGLLFVGLCSAWACVFSYNRLKAYRTAGMKFTDTESWKRDKGRDEFL